jgi:hypothetical protein
LQALTIRLAIISRTHKHKMLYLAVFFLSHAFLNVLPRATDASILKF